MQRNVVFAVRAGWTKRVCQIDLEKEVAYVLHTESDHESESDRKWNRSIGSVYFDILGLKSHFLFCRWIMDVNLPLMVRYLRERPVALVDLCMQFYY